jgi:hypothetical protein
MWRKRWRRAISTAVVPLVLAAGAGVAAGTAGWVAWAPGGIVAGQEEGVVTLRDGRKIEGVITEGGDSISINASGIVTTIPRAQVVSIEYGTPEQRLERRLAALEAGDVAGRMEVADEALRRGLLDLAQRVADDVNRIDPGNARANAMLDHIDRQRQLDLARGQGVRPGTRQDGTTRPSPRAIRPTSGNVLSEAQINRIRQRELRLADVEAARDRPRISFRDGVVKRFVDSRPDLEFREFNRGNDVAKAMFMLRESRDPEIHEDIWIASHPTSVLEYLRRVEPVVLNGCATSGCHGGDAAASFALYNPARDDATSYTNYYLLSTGGVPVKREGVGAFGAEEQDGDTALARLIDRSQPDESLLLTYMLPRERTRFPHPEVEGYNGMVLSVDAANYEIIRNWIRTLPLLPADEYGFEFKLDLPTTRAATRPGTRSAPGSTRPADGANRPGSGR